MGAQTGTEGCEAFFYDVKIDVHICPRYYMSTNEPDGHGDRPPTPSADLAVVQHRARRVRVLPVAAPTEVSDLELDVVAPLEQRAVRLEQRAPGVGANRVGVQAHLRGNTPINQSERTNRRGPLA